MTCAIWPGSSFRSSIAISIPSVAHKDVHAHSLYQQPTRRSLAPIARPSRSAGGARGRHRTGPDAVSRSNGEARSGRSVQISSPSRTGLPCSSIRQSLGRMICWIGWLIEQPDRSCRRSRVGRHVRPRPAHKAHGQVRTRTSSGSQSWRLPISVLASASQRGDCRWPTPPTSIRSHRCWFRAVIKGQDKELEAGSSSA